MASRELLQSEETFRGHQITNTYQLYSNFTRYANTRALCGARGARRGPANPKYCDMLCREQWKTTIPPYQPVFMDGWSPDYQVDDQPLRR